jgi:pimeloyl-ACP methyl ester carboxylesterase
MPAVADHFEALFGWPPPAALRDLQIPVLLMYGERTRRATREIVTLLARQLPQVIQSRLYDAGHMGPVTHAGAFNAALVCFLDSEVATAPALALAA